MLCFTAHVKGSEDCEVFSLHTGGAIIYNTWADNYARDMVSIRRWLVAAWVYYGGFVH